MIRNIVSVMNKNNIKVIISSYIIFLLIIVEFNGLLFFGELIGSNSIRVKAEIIVDINGNGNYTSIQAAIDNASIDDTIYVWAGTYYENIIINKSVTLIGNGTKDTIINGSGIGDVVYVTANWVNISGFTIRGSGKGPMPSYYHAGIELNNVNNISIKNNNCSNNDLGIFCCGFGNNLIMNNNCSDNSKIGAYINSKDNKIINNYCNLNKMVGICLDGSEFNFVVNNYCSYNSNVGIHFDLHSNFNYIRNNTCENNTVGFKFFNCHNNTFFENNILNNNEGGLWLQYGSKDNYLFHNNFISKKNQVYDQNIGFNFFNNSNHEGNYWSDYNGTDIGNMIYSWDITGKHLIRGDGIGDTKVPHLELDYYPFTNKMGWLKPGVPSLKDPGNIDNDGNYNLSWNTTIRTIGYVLEEDNTTSFDSPIEIYNGSLIIFNISRKTNGTYYYRVKAYNEKYESPWSNIVDIIVDWLPNIPKNLNVSTYPPGNTLNLTWDLNLVDTNQYILEYKNGSMANWQQLNPIFHPGFTFNHTGLVDGIKYDYRIQARDNRGQLSNFSDIISGIPWDSVPPAPPNGLRVVSTTNNSISLNWNPNTEDDLEGYHIFRNEIANPSIWGEPLGIIPKGTEKYIDTGLDEETTYYYVLTAFDEVPNNSSFSNMAFGTPILGPHGPVINNSQDDFSIPEDTVDDSTINLYDWFIDINNDTLEFKCKGNENISVTIFQENGTVILIPKKDWNGKETLIFYANDSVYEIFDNVTITVTPVNDPPGPAVIITPEEGIKVENGTLLDFSGLCDDVDLIYGDILTFNWSSNISGRIGSSENLTDIVLQPGQHRILLEVSDIAGETSRAMVNITILPEYIPMFDIKLELVPNIVELKPGEQTSIRAIVTNLGEVDDRVVLKIEDQNVEGIEVIINEPKIKNVILNGTAEFNITIKALDNAEKGEIKITFIAASTKAAEYEIIEEDEAILTVQIMEKEKQGEDKLSTDYWIIILIIILIIIILIMVGILIKRRKQPEPEEPTTEEQLEEEQDALAELSQEE